MSLTAKEWHAWFIVQAGWTRSTREWLQAEAGVASAHTVLEVGCGTGVITGELARSGSGRVVGLDIDPSMLAFAAQQQESVEWVQGDAHALPLSGGRFDVVVCHYLLLWLENPAQGLQEMARVARPGGVVLVCAEPDYGGRIDYPPELEPLGKLQAEALRRQGADPDTGRRLGEFFAAAGLQATIGVMAGRWELTADEAGFEAEWEMRERDLARLVSSEKLAELRALDQAALESGKRTLFVPTFYGLGRKEN